MNIMLQEVYLAECKNILAHAWIIDKNYLLPYIVQRAYFELNGPLITFMVCNDQFYVKRIGEDRLFRVLLYSTNAKT